MCCVNRPWSGFFLSIHQCFCYPSLYYKTEYPSICEDHWWGQRKNLNSITWEKWQHLVHSRWFTLPSILRTTSMNNDTASSSISYKHSYIHTDIYFLFLQTTTTASIQVPQEELKSKAFLSKMKVTSGWVELKINAKSSFSFTLSL